MVQIQPVRFPQAPLIGTLPRLPLYQEFHQWVEMGQKLLDLHIGFESAEPYPLERHDRKDVDPKRAILRTDKSSGTITLDERTTLAGIPAQAWEYRLGSRSALEWVLDQYKERKPRDPTIREKFNTYRFSNHKERVIDLLRRVCTVSVATMEIVNSMAHRGAGGTARASPWTRGSEIRPQCRRMKAQKDCTKCCGTHRQWTCLSCRWMPIDRTLGFTFCS